MLESPFDVSYRIGDDLRDVPNDADQGCNALSWLNSQLEKTADCRQQAQLLGLMGSYARLLGDLPTAQRHIALAIDKAQSVGDIQLKTANRIRLAHVYHWQENYAESEALFDAVIERCQSIPELKMYLDFAYQHAGKCKFDRKQYEAALSYFEAALLLRMSKLDQSLVSSTQYAIDITTAAWGKGL